MHRDFVPQAQTVHQRLYKEVQTFLVNEICQKLRDLWASQTWILHHGNALAHPHCEPFLGLQTKHHTEAFTVFSEPHSPQFLPFCKTKRDNQRETLRRS